MRGKGKNLIELFKYCDDLDIDYIALFDSDIKTIKPNWVFSLLNPLITKKFDYTAPVYSRGCYDGNVTNNFAYPLTYAIFGVELQQPIGGEFGLSKRLYKYLLQQPVGKAELGFGIDIFMTFHALGGGFKICEVYLGEKKHNPGFPTLMNKFLEFSESAIKVSRMYKNKLNKVKRIKKYKNIPVFKTKKQPNKDLARIQLEKFAKIFKNNLSEYDKYLGINLKNKLFQIIISQKPTVSLELWIETLARFLKVCYKRSFNTNLIPKICYLIAPIFYWRVISFWKEMKFLNPVEINKRIKKQARLLKRKMVANLNTNKKQKM